LKELFSTFVVYKMGMKNLNHQIFKDMTIQIKVFITNITTAT